MAYYSYIRRGALLGLCFVGLLSAQAQKPAASPYIEIGPLHITTGQRFSITIHSEGKNIGQRDAFPTLPGFRKEGQSSSMQMRTAGGTTVLKYSITQYYIPQKAGHYQLPALRIRINDKIATHPAADITVSEGGTVPHKPSFSPGNSPFDQFFDMFEEPEDEVFVEVEDEAFLALTTNKDEVFLGEGFTATLAFYVATTNRASMDFYKLGDQINGILSDIKPEGCWEENFSIQQLEREQVQLQGKPYFRYVLYRSVFYPLQMTPVTFPSVGLKVRKYKVAKSPSIWGRRTQPAYKTFYTRKKQLQVKPLPSHPLSDQVAVGRYRISERPVTEQLRTGEGLNYPFTISGEGNISAISAPHLRKESRLQLYEPQVSQQVHRSQGRVFGQKQFTYHILPQEAGTYPLAELFSWVYFDPTRERYDTLRPRTVLQVGGENIRNLQVSHSQPQDTFYNVLLQEKPAAAWFSGPSTHWTAAIVFLVLIVSIMWLILRKPA